MKNNILKVCNLTIRYGKAAAVKDLSFELNEGEYVGIIGPNGSGKTTLINGILGLIEPTNGTIEFDKNILIGYLPQKTVGNNKMFPAKVKEIVTTGLLFTKKGFKFYKRSDYDKVDSILKKLDIFDIRNKKIGELSGGQVQKVLLARALVSSPKILILDEPTNYLDSKTRGELYQILKRLNIEDNVTILVVSHDLKTIGKYIDKVLYLETELLFYGDYNLFLKSQKLIENQVLFK